MIAQGLINDAFSIKQRRQSEGAQPTIHGPDQGQSNRQRDDPDRLNRQRFCKAQKI